MDKQVEYARKQIQKVAAASQCKRSWFGGCLVLLNIAVVVEGCWYCRAGYSEIRLLALDAMLAGGCAVFFLLALVQTRKGIVLESTSFPTAIFDDIVLEYARIIGVNPAAVLIDTGSGFRIGLRYVQNLGLVIRLAGFKYLTQSQIEAFIAHELGHVACGHISLKQHMIQPVSLSCLLCSIVSLDSAPNSTFLFVLICSVALTLFRHVMLSLLSQQAEKEADAIASIVCGGESMNAACIAVLQNEPASAWRHRLYVRILLEAESLRTDARMGISLSQAVIMTRTTAWEKLQLLVARLTSTHPPVTTRVHNNLKISLV